MPTWEVAARFRRDWEKLTPSRRTAFQKAVEKLVSDLRAGGKFRKSLRVGGIEGAPGVYEMTWAQDGRATFEYGTPVRGTDAHIRWRRVGTHSIYSEP
jgi:hypothetical protein